MAGRLTVASDRDARGRAAALAERAHGLGWRVDLLAPGTGRDFNGLLREGVDA